MSVNINVAVFWDVVPCSLVGKYKCFEEHVCSLQMETSLMTVWHYMSEGYNVLGLVVVLLSSTAVHIFYL